MEARRLTKMALLTALLCVSAWISFPLPFSPAHGDSINISCYFDRVYY